MRLFFKKRNRFFTDCSELSNEEKRQFEEEVDEERRREEDEWQLIMPSG